MFKLSEDFKRALIDRYHSEPVTHGGRPLRFSGEAAFEAIGAFVRDEQGLKRLDPELHIVFTKRAKRPGYSQDNVLKVFKTGTSQRDFIDLLCYYTYRLSYEQCVIQEKVPDELSSFFCLTTQRPSEKGKHRLAQRVESIQLDHYKRRLSNEPHIDLKTISFEYEYFNLEDLEVIKKFPTREIFGVDIPWHTIEKCYTKNSEIIKGIKVVHSAGERIVGFFILYPLNKVGDRLINNGTIIKSSQLTPEHICRDYKSAVSIYVSYVYGEKGSESPVLEKLKSELRLILTICTKIKKIYVKPITEDGLRVTQRHNFSPLEVTKELFCSSSQNQLNSRIKIG